MKKWRYVFPDKVSWSKSNAVNYLRPMGKGLQTCCFCSSLGALRGIKS